MIARIINDAEKIESGDLKQCPKCGEWKEARKFFEKHSRKRYCDECRNVKSTSTRFSDRFGAKPLNAYSPTKENKPTISPSEKGNDFTKDIEAAISKKGDLVIHYTNTYGKSTKRRITPVSRDGIFLRAFCHLTREQRTFRLDRIKALENAALTQPLGSAVMTGTGKGGKYKVCPTCGKKNNPDFSRCWKCTAVFP